jgi:NADH dehydrogenase
VTADHVRLASGEILPAHTVIWAAGARAHPVAAAMGLPTNRAGRVEVARDLSVPGYQAAARF